jgi:hypothetical protein
MYSLLPDGRPCPRIQVVRHPRSCAVPEGARFRLVFEVVCTTEDELLYQWYFSGGKITGANSNVYIR